MEKCIVATRIGFPSIGTTHWNLREEHVDRTPYLFGVKIRSNLTLRSFDPAGYDRVNAKPIRVTAGRTPRYCVQPLKGHSCCHSTLSAHDLIFEKKSKHRSKPYLKLLQNAAVFSLQKWIKLLEGKSYLTIRQIEANLGTVQDIKPPHHSIVFFRLKFISRLLLTKFFNSRVPTTTILHRKTHITGQALFQPAEKKSEKNAKFPMGQRRFPGNGHIVVPPQRPAP